MYNRYDYYFIMFWSILTVTVAELSKQSHLIWLSLCTGTPHSSTGLINLHLPVALEFCLEIVSLRLNMYTFFIADFWLIISSDNWHHRVFSARNSSEFWSVKMQHLNYCFRKFSMKKARFRKLKMF